MQCFNVRRFRFKMSQVDMTAESSLILQDFEEKSDIMVPRPVPCVLLLISLRYTLRAPHLPPAVLVSQWVFTHFQPCVWRSAPVAEYIF